MYIENEWKFLVSKEQFGEIRLFFEENFQIQKNSFEQTNYYYDTKDFCLSKEGITARIREKNKKLNGTYKKHLENGMSKEETFIIDSIPEFIMYGENRLIKLGSLTTKRDVFFVENICEICFDKNSYLGKTDYEIEIEFIGNYSGIIYLPKKTHIKSKSDRFISKLNEIILSKEVNKEKSI